MKCKNHPNREANKFCSSCNIPICDSCAEEVSSGQYFCFNCAMLQTVSVVGNSLADKKAKLNEKVLEKKKIELGPFHYFVIASCVVIAVMWAVILFGGKKAPGSKINYAKQERVFLFMIDNAIRRYYSYENERYPEKLTDLVPEYLPMADEDLHYLGALSYNKDKDAGYILYYTDSKPGRPNIILSFKGIKSKADSINEDK